MVDPDHGGDFGLFFLSKDGKEIRTSSLFFESEYRSGATIQLKELESHTVSLVLPVAPGKQLVKRLTFRNGSYDCDVEIEMRNLGDIIANYEYHVTWESGVDSRSTTASMRQPSRADTRSRAES
jgi:hypothetical protein